MIEELVHRVVAEAGYIQDAQVLAETAIFDLAMLDIAGSSLVPVAAGQASSPGDKPSPKIQ